MPRRPTAHHQNSRIQPSFLTSRPSWAALHLKPTPEHLTHYAVVYLNPNVWVPIRFGGVMRARYPPFSSAHQLFDEQLAVNPKHKKLTGYWLLAARIRQHHRPIRDVRVNH